MTAAPPVLLTVSGTRRGLTPAQRAALPAVLATLPAELHHGGAVGVDEQVDAYIAGFAATLPHRLRPRIDVYPVGNERWNYWQRLALIESDTRRVVHIADPKPLRRNVTMVRATTRLLAFPATQEERLRSGTWATVRAARRAGRPVTLVLPDGQIVEES